jgi:adenylate cyclase
MVPEAVEHKLAAILSADVVGYSRLMAEDEAATVRTLADYREEVGLLVRQHRGRVVDTAGDSLLAEFPTATEAVGCAVEIQGVLRVRNAPLPADRRMEFRIGIHLGEVRVEGERLYGDGVNIAARLEGLAEPGGMCISDMVYRQVESKLDLRYDDLGDQSLKNIPEPVHVYGVQPRSQPEASARASTPPDKRPRRLRTALVATAAVGLLLGVGLWASWPRPLGLVIDLVGLSGAPVDPALPEKPSIVVLPFDNMSKDPSQDYFSDGITEDLTTDLAKVPGLFVIARNSAFTYKGTPVNVERVGRELGVRYVLEGSVRKSADRLRINTQLTDATTGFHVWSERYDRDLGEVFALQSEISTEIMLALQLQIPAAEIERIRDKSPEELSAYDMYLRAGSHLRRFTRADHREARRLLERAIELDPGYADAYSSLGGTYILEYSFLWSSDKKILKRAAELARHSLQLDPSLSGSYTILASAHFWNGRIEEAIAAAERSLAINPNSAGCYGVLGAAQAAAGQVASALGSLKRALRLDPLAVSPAWVGLAYVNLRAGRTTEAIELLERVRASNPDMVLARIALAGQYEASDQHQEARSVVEEILRVSPDLTAELAAARAPPGFDRVAFRADLRKAGLP